MKKITLALLLVAVLLFSGCASNSPNYIDTTASRPAGLNSSELRPVVDYTIISPYRAVDWETWGQYKAGLHVHSTNSDGENLFNEMLEDHYRKDYDIFAMTDHNVLVSDWTTAQNGLTQARADEIAAGMGDDMRRQTDVDADLVERHAAHDLGAHPRQETFVLIRKGDKKIVRHDRFEDRIAQKFKPFVVHGRSVRKRYGRRFMDQRQFV